MITDSKGQQRILVLGGTTHHNRGDRAMHEGLLRWLREIAPESPPLFLASNPDLTREVLGIESAMSPDAALAQPWTRETPSSTRQRLQAWWRGLRFALSPSPEFRAQLRHARAVLVHGSGSMNSLWWHDWLYVKAAEVHAAKRAGVPVFMTSQGVGPPFTHWLDRHVARSMFQRCSVVGVRDGEQSIGLLRDIGVASHRCLHTGDDALLVPPTTSAADRLLASIPKQRTVIGINVRDSSTYGRRYAKPVPQLWADALSALVDQGVDAHFVFIPISYDKQDDDRVPARQVAQLMPAHADRITVIEDELNAAELRGLTARCQIAAGISYHFLLFCLAANVPTLGAWQNAYYQQKQGGLFQLYGRPDDMLELAATDSASLSASLLRLLNERADRVADLTAMNRQLEAHASNARDAIRALIQA